MFRKKKSKHALKKNKKELRVRNFPDSVLLEKTV